MLEGFSEALAQEVAPLGKVTLVEPGTIRTEFGGSGKLEDDPDKTFKVIYQWAFENNPPLRCFRKNRSENIEMKLESMKADLERRRTMAETAIFMDNT